MWKEIVMKKLLGIVVLGLLWCNVGSADVPWDDFDVKSLNENLTTHGWKIDSVKQVSIYKEPYDIYILKKRGWILYCKIELSNLDTDCYTP